MGRYNCLSHVQTTWTGQVCFHTSLIALAGGFTRFPSTEIDHAAELPEGKMPCFWKLWQNRVRTGTLVCLMH